MTVPELTLMVADPSGLHARPAARFVQAAARFQSRIVIRLSNRLAVRTNWAAGRAWSPAGSMTVRSTSGTGQLRH